MGCKCSQSKKVLTPGEHIIKADQIRIGPGLFILPSENLFHDIYRVESTITATKHYEIKKVISKTRKEERAVKIFRKDLASDFLYKKLQNELKIIKKIDHPNILRIFEIFEEPKRIFIVMELCKGGGLFEEILNRQSFSEQIAASIIKELFLALVYIHNKKIVHRDIKAENILIEEKGGQMSIKLVNFYAAIEMKKPLRGLIGTAYYIAPEVISGEYDEKCDLWSTGVLLFMLLAGYPPFDGNSDEEILSKIKIGKFEFEETIWNTISLPAKDLISKLLTNANTRLSAFEALSHPWITENANIKKLNSLNIVFALENIKNFHHSNKLREAVETFIATQCINKHEIKVMNEAFKAIDINGDGKISKEELLVYYSKYFPDENAEVDVDSIMKEVDTYNNGYIDYTEFIKASLSQKALMSSENLERAFEVFDRDHSGTISCAELKKILEGGLISDDEVWKGIVSSFDTNFDGEIDIHEFKKILLKQV